jgi:ribosomal protein L32
MLPVQRQSHGRSRRRRAHDALKPVKLTRDPLSGLPKRHHRVSKDSGYVRAGLRISVPKLGIGVDRV